MHIEDELEKCLRFDTEQPEEPEIEKMARKVIAGVRELRVKTTGWSGYGWKDGQYIDSLEEYFSSPNI